MAGYSERCAAHLGVTYSGGAGKGVIVAERGGGCANDHSGTSAAAPNAAGVIALLLQVRPDLGWRDVQQLIVESGVVVDAGDASWYSL